MSLFGKKEKKEIEMLRQQMNPQQLEMVDIEKQLEYKRKELQDFVDNIEKCKSEVLNLNSTINSLKRQVIETNDEILLQSFGFYKPRYIYGSSEEYNNNLKLIREQQKIMIKDKTAVLGNQNWTVNNSASQGKKMLADIQKLLLRAFNSECDDIIGHVKFNNIEASEKRITASRDAISKLGNIMQIAISNAYYTSKIQELYLTYEYQVKKQKEKEEQKEARARLREEAKLAKELEDAKKNIEKEQKHYLNALKNIENFITSNGSNDDLIAKKKEIEEQLNRLNTAIQDIDYRSINQKAGYVYIISNIGSFGENVYKIGMTRRLDPMERIDELGDASVPFNFDVHAMIFTEDAPALEAALHKAFADKKVNFVNIRREFFKVSLEEIKKVIRENYDKTVEFINIPPAEQYRQSLALKTINN